MCLCVYINTYIDHLCMDNFTCIFIIFSRFSSYRLRRTVLKEIDLCIEIQSTTAFHEKPRITHHSCFKTLR